MKKSILKECLKIAVNKISNQKEYFLHYCFIIQNNKIVDWSINKQVDPPIHLGYHSRIVGYPKWHAEYSAWVKSRDLIDKTKYFECINIRLDKNGCMKISAPCSCCYNFLKSLGCRVFWFTTSSGWAKIR
jgi:hypothetical protein